MAARKKRQIKKILPKNRVVEKAEDGNEKESIEIVLSVPKGASVTSVSELQQASLETDKDEKVASLIVEEKESSEEIATSNLLVKEEKTEITTMKNSQEDALPVEEGETGNSIENTQEENSEKEEESLAEELSKDEEEEKGSLFKKILLWGGIAVIVGVLLGVALKLAYERGVAVGQEQAQVKQQNATQAPALSATPKPENIEKTKYTIKVLNGSGIDGEATRVKGIFEQAGYDVSSVGNASTSDIETTNIQTKSEVIQSWIDDLKIVLSKSFVVSYSKDLDDNTAIDVVVTVGSKKAE